MGTAPLVKIGQYEVKDKIAAGGMATVYKAIKTGIGGFRSMVAVKLLHPHLASDPEYRRMFMEEARIGALLQHRCLLNVLDYGEEEGVAYMVTEYFPSISLEDLVSKTGPLPLSEALFVLAEAAEGLAALHDAKDLSGRRLGLVHRDVSPQNILVGHDGRVKVIDYGIVKRDDPTEKTKPGIVKGKCRYMAPEQAAAGKVDSRSDLFSLGLSFLRSLTGVKPHGDGDTGEIMARARKGIDVESQLSGLADGNAVRGMLRRMLATAPAERYTSGQELARDARALIQEREQSYDVHAFQTWLSGNLPSSRTRKGAKAAVEPKGKPKSPTAADKATGLPGGEGKSLHPRWIFMGLAALFLAALVAHLLDTLL